MEVFMNVLRCFCDIFWVRFDQICWKVVLGIQVVVEVGLGLGVFAGDALGIGNSVRQLSAPWQLSVGGMMAGGMMGIGNHWNIYGIYTPCDSKWTSSSPSWRSLDHLQGSLNHPKKVNYKELPGRNILGIIGWILIGQSNGAD